MVVNVEGKLKKLALNHLATVIYNELPAVPHGYDPVVGDVLVCDSDMVR